MSPSPSLQPVNMSSSLTLSEAVACRFELRLALVALGRVCVGQWVVGRSPLPSLFNALFHSRSVTRRHAEISVDSRTNVSPPDLFYLRDANIGQLLMVEDLHPMHGTYVNRAKPASSITHYVHYRDILQFGSKIQYEESKSLWTLSAEAHVLIITEVTLLLEPSKVSYGSAPHATKHTVPIRACRPGSFRVPGK